MEVVSKRKKKISDHSSESDEWREESLNCFLFLNLGKLIKWLLPWLRHQRKPKSLKTHRFGAALPLLVTQRGRALGQPFQGNGFAMFPTLWLPVTVTSLFLEKNGNSHL